uniref:Kinesin-like protein n=1 Tax=Marsilea vestita TaxID=59764 RepID=A0A142KWC6_MARVE|nr:kinesin 14-Ic protein [Marsilea vestita]
MKRVPTYQRIGRETRRTTQHQIQNENESTGGPPQKKRKYDGELDLNIYDKPSRVTDVLCSLNGQDVRKDKSQQPEPNEGWEENRMSSDDVEALLNTKILAKNKFDLKGKNEQMTEYIKKLRACIKHFLQVESAYILQLEQLRSQVSDEKSQRATLETVMSERNKKLASDLSEAQRKCTELEESLASAQVENQKLISTHEKDVAGLESSKNECEKLTKDLQKAKIDSKAYEDKVKNLQDVNKRLSEYNTSLQDYNSKLQNDASAAIQENAKTQQEKLELLEKLSALRGNNASLQTQLDSAKLTAEEESKQKNMLSRELERIRVDVQKIDEERRLWQARINAVVEENNRFRDFTGKSASELEIVTTKAVALEENYYHQIDQIKVLQQQLESAKIKTQTLELSLEMHKKSDTDHIVKISELQLKLAEAERRLNEGELIRRKLHNTIQELKGNIRVFCRVRPLLGDEDPEHVPAVQYPQYGDLVGRGVELVQTEGQKYTFSFDKVFGPDMKQENVFEEISQLVQSALDGYKVCIFAYGQTGSGKTYTMLGQPDNESHKGLIPRSLEQIFKSSQILQGQGWTFKMQASMLEIYNETIRDLLSTSKSEPPQKPDSTPTAAKQYAIKHDTLGTHVSDLTLVEVTSWKEVSTLLHQAAQSRTVGRTAMNEQSSRSHCVFTLRIVGTNENTDQQVNGVLNLVDLAGSERLSKSQVTGDRLKETQAINKSLSSLGDVILSIANKEQHVPYRNSKLTYLLQPCLGGDSKTLMFVNIAPDSKSLHESLCSLRFAAKVNSCEIGVPKRQAARLSNISNNS